jgi:hypothetical protein
MDAYSNEMGLAILADQHCAGEREQLHPRDIALLLL